MQFINLHIQQEKIYSQIQKRINNVLKHGNYILGPEVRELEERLANYVGRKYAVGVSSGTEALLLILMAYGIKAGDAIFTTPFTFIATASMVKLLGATPIFSDIKEDTFNLDVKKLRETIDKTIQDGKFNPKAIIAVDLFGQLADYSELEKIAKDYNLLLIEDAAQSFGASYNGKRACSFGDISATSFFPAKPLGCYGDGGMIFTDNEEIYQKLISLRVHGKNVNDKYDNIRLGINGRLDTLQAAILLAKFEIFNEEIELRQKVADYYSKALKNYVKIPVIKPNYISAWAQYSILSNFRNKIIANLKKYDIPTAIYYPKPLHMQGVFKDLNYKANDFPIANKVSKKILSLPFYPYLKREEQDFIIEKIFEVL